LAGTLIVVTAYHFEANVFSVGYEVLVGDADLKKVSMPEHQVIAFFIYFLD
jgi:hypothetical protein